MKFLLFVTVGVLSITGLLGDSPQLEIQPHGAEISREEGESMALTCKLKVGDSQRVTQLEWLDSRNEPIKSTNIGEGMYIQKLQDEQGAMLIFTKLKKNMEGTYTCRANYDHTELLDVTVSVNIIMDITWKNVPAEQFPKLGENKKLTCIVHGDPHPIIDWLREGQRLNFDSNNRYIIETDGLLIKNVQESDDGLYTCRALVPATGKIDERVIRVEVLIPPVIEPIPPVLIVEGEQARVQCKASGKPPANYTWIRDDTREDLSLKDRFSVDARTGVLSVTKAERTDGATYRCIATNPLDRAEQPVNITVLAKPNIFELLNITAPVGNDTSLICKAYGQPLPSITFRKLNRQDTFAVGIQPDDDRIRLENRENPVNGFTAGILSIDRLNRSDDGLYECIAENSVNKAYKNGHIAVQFPPTFERTKNYPPIWTWGDRPGNLTCIPEAIPNATIQWKFGGYELATKDNIIIEGNGPTSNLIVTPYNNVRYYGRYECIARNILGTASRYIELLQAKVPDPIQQVTLEAITATSIKFNIVGPMVSGLPLRSIIVRFVLEGMPWDHAWNKTWSVNAPYIIEGLSPQRTYQFRFAAANDVGVGGFGGGSAQYTMLTRSAPTEPKILLPPEYADQRDALVTSPYADHYEVRWKVPHDNGDPIISYVINYCVAEFRDGQWYDSKTDCSSEINISFEYQNYELTQLVPDTTYKLELRARNPIGLSSPAQIRIKTARGLDTMIPSQDKPSMSSGLILGIVIGAVVLVLILVDVVCFCVNRTGILAYCCDCARSKRVDEEDSKLGSYKAAPAHPNSLNLPQPIKLVPSPEDEREPLSPENRSPQIVDEKKSLSVEYDGKEVHTKTMPIGRYSAV